MSQEPVLFARSIRRNIAYGLELADVGSPTRNGVAGEADSGPLESVNADPNSPLLVPVSEPDSDAESDAAGAGAPLTRVRMAHIREAAAAANAHTFIGEMRDGYDTPVGERGTTISGII